MIPTYQDHQRRLEDERQALIKKYEKEGYFRPWAISKADLEIRDKAQALIDSLVPLNQLSPLD